MYLQERHCEITLARTGIALRARIRATSKGAQTTLNGVPLTAADAPLAHLDRIVFGPCRMLCLYLTSPLTPEQRGDLT